MLGSCSRVTRKAIGPVLYGAQILGRRCRYDASSREGSDDDFQKNLNESRGRKRVVLVNLVLQECAAVASWPQCTRTPQLQHEGLCLGGDQQPPTFGCANRLAVLACATLGHLGIHVLPALRRRGT